MQFKVGQFAKFRHNEGYIRFVNSEYITLCVGQGMFDCCLIITPDKQPELIVDESVPYKQWKTIPECQISSVVEQPPCKR